MGSPEVRSAVNTQPITPAEARAIAKKATIYGYPLVDSYRIQYSFFVDRNSPEFKAPWNTLANMARVYTPEDKTVQTPNSDTPYSTIGVDLRTEPLVFTVPAVETNRYYSLQFIDMYTFNFAYVGSRATGNGPGRYLLAGPNWQGEKPTGINAVIRSETALATIVYRTQLFDAADIENVKRIQTGYKVEPLSQFLDKPAPKAAPELVLMEPLTAEEERTSLQFFNVLNAVLQFGPTHPSEKALMARFSRIEVGAGKTIDLDTLSPEMRQALQDGMVDAWKELEDFKTAQIATGKITGGDITGSRAHLKNNYLYRMAATAVGIYGNSKEEAMYPVYFTDSDNKKLDGTQRYTLRFGPDQLPPVYAFWSLTMYELPSSLLYANPLNRYLINSSMLPNLKRDPDGGVTIYLQNESPGADKESNWLPAPKGIFFMAMRLYWPRAEALNDNWKAPPVRRAS